MGFDDCLNCFLHQKAAPGNWKRLFGAHQNNWQKLQRLQRLFQRGNLGLRVGQLLALAFQHFGLGILGKLLVAQLLLHRVAEALSVFQLFFEAGALGR